jgi:hypothetical protein
MKSDSTMAAVALQRVPVCVLGYCSASQRQNCDQTSTATLRDSAGEGVRKARCGIRLRADSGFRRVHESKEMPHNTARSFHSEHRMHQAVDCDDIELSFQETE